MTSAMNAYEKRQDAQIGEALRLRREALGFTQAQLGKAMAVTFQQVQKYEQGRNSVRVAKLLMAAEFLKCEVGDLLGQKPEETPGTARLVHAWSALGPEQQEAVTALVEAFRRTEAG